MNTISKLSLSLVLSAGIALSPGFAHASSQNETYAFFSSKSCKVSEYESVRPRGTPMPLVQVADIKPQLNSIWPVGQAQMILSDGQAIEFSASANSNGTYDVSVGVLSKRLIGGGYERKAWAGFGEASVENGGHVSVNADSTTKVFAVTCE